MKNKRNAFYSLILMFTVVCNFAVHAQQKKDAQNSVETKEVSTSQEPKGIVRTIKQDKKGNIWITSWEGVFKYDGKTFTNVTRKVSTARFFSVLEDRKGNFWFASIGSGVYYYDGKTFQNFTTKDGLAGNEVTNIYEDKTGAVWFGTGNGASRYDGKTFQNFKMNEAHAQTDSVYTGAVKVFAQTDSVYTGAEKAHAQTDSVYTGAEKAPAQTDSVYTGAEKAPAQTDSVYTGAEKAPAQTDSVYTGAEKAHAQTDSVYTGTDSVHIQADSVYTGNGFVHNWADSVRVSFYQHPLPEKHWVHNDVNAIIEDKTGKFWIGTRGHATVYDGKTFTTITHTNGKPFTNVRSIIKDKKGNIWLGGYDGLWRYDGNTFTNFTQQFVGYIYEDKKGNIWTSSESANAGTWVLSRYDEKSLTNKKPTVTEITNKPMIFGILEDDKRNIWFGALDGVYRYDGKAITDFKNAAGQK